MTYHKTTKRSSKEGFWKDHVDHFQESGLTQRHYCKNYGLNETTFSLWKKKLSASGSCLKLTDSQQRLTEVPSCIQSGVSGTESSLDIIVGNELTIRVTRAFDAVLLKEVLRLMGVSL